MSAVSRRSSALLLWLAALLAAAPAGAEWADWIAEASFRTEFDDNLNNSAFQTDEESEFSYYPAIRVGRFYQLGDYTRLSATIEAEGQFRHRFDLLTGGQYGVRLAAFRKLGTGDVPWIEWHGFVGKLNVREDEADSTLYETGLTAGKRFTDRFDAFLSYLFTVRNGGNGIALLANTGTDVYDQANHELGVTGNFLATQRILLSTGYSYRRGEFHSSCTVGNVAEVLAREGSNAKAVALDTIFGHASLARGRRGCIYRLEGDAHSAFVNLSYALNHHISLDANYRYQQGKAKSLIYRRNVAGLSVTYRY